MPDSIAVEQAPEAAPTPEVTEPVQPEAAPTGETKGGVDSLNYEDLQDVSGDEALDFLHRGKALEIPDRPAVEEAEKAPEVVVEATEKAIEKAAETELPANLDEPIPGRFSPKQFAADEQKAMRLQHALNDGKKPGDAGFVSLWEAKAQIDKMTPGKATEPPAPTAVEAIATKATEQQAALAALRAQKKEALEFGTPIGDLADLEEQIETARDAVSRENTRLAIAQDRVERQQAQEAAARTQSAQEIRAASHAATLKGFPDLAKEGSPLRAAVLQAIEERKDPSHFEHDLLETPRAPKYVLDAGLEILAEKEGISVEQARTKYGAPQAPVAAKTEEPPAKPATTQPKKVLPASGSHATQPPKGAPSLAEVLAEVGDDGEKAWEAIHGRNQRTYLK